MAGNHARHRMAQRKPAARPGFTLIELLVVLAITSVLMAMLATALVKVRGATRNFLCQNKLKTVAFEFQTYPDDTLRTERESPYDQGRSSDFTIEDFQERVYGIDEYWPNALRNLPEAAYQAPKQPLMCPAGPTELRRQAGLPCRDYAVGPPQNVSTAFNRRLYQVSVQQAGRWVLREVKLSPRVLERPWVPLVFDVDGRAAVARRALPYFSAPAAGDPGRYAGDRMWFPALRHGGELNAAFVGGHVLSSRRPERESGWDWKYQPSTM